MLAAPACNVTTRSMKARTVLATTTNTLKRKAEDNDELDAMNKPRKLPALSGGTQRSGMDGPVRPARPIANLPRSRVASQGTGLMARSTGAGPPMRSRATSAPPKNMVVGRGHAPSNRGRGPAGRMPSGPSRPGFANLHSVGNDQFQALHDRVSSIDKARAEDAARVAAEMESERTKVEELRTNHVTLSKELAEARSQEITQRRELVNASGQIDDLKRKHVREVEDLEDAARKKDREIRELKDDLRYVKEDLEREREAVTSLKATVAHQSTAHITLNAQNSALEAQLSALKSTLDCKTADASQMRFELETARKKVTGLEEEVREAEMTRRRLHNTIQELKGNIRVFCRVRPVIPHDVPADAKRLGSSAFIEEIDDDEVERNARYMANIDFPDTRDHKEIVLSSKSESATGQERKETWNFSFDRV